MACTTSSCSPWRRARSAPTIAWEPSTSWVSALPMSCRKAPRTHDRPVDAQLVGQQPRRVAGLDQVGQHVLPVRRPVAQPAHGEHELGVQVGDAHLEARVLPRRAAQPLHLLDAALVDLLDPGGVDPAVGQQLLQGEPGDLAADRVEAAEDDGLRGVVDDQVHAGDLLEGPDVAALTPDDPALEVVAGQVDHRHREVGALLGGEPLDGGAEHTLGLRLGVAAGLALDVAGQGGGAQPGLVLGGGQHLGPRLVDAEPGHPLQQRGAVGRSARHLGGLLLEPATLLVLAGLPLGEALLAPLDVEPLLVQVAVQLGLPARGQLAGDRRGRPRRPAAPRPRPRRASRRAWTTAAAVRWRVRRGGWRQA